MNGEVVPFGRDLAASRPDPLPSIIELRELIINHSIDRGEVAALDVLDAGRHRATCPACGSRSLIVEGSRSADAQPASMLACESCDASRDDLLSALRGGGVAQVVGEWPAPALMDPCAVPAAKKPALPGFPYLHAGCGALIVGPTGGGRSSLVQAGAYDAALAGLPVAYLGSEITEDEFNIRAADLAERRGDHVDDDTRAQLSRVHYYRLTEIMVLAWADPDSWAAFAARYRVVIIDPLSRAGAALDLNFDQSNADFISFYVRVVQPLVDAGVAVVLLDNVGHSEAATKRAKGASAKQDSVDLTFFCKRLASPARMVISAGKVRSVVAPVQEGDQWVFDRERQRIVKLAEPVVTQSDWRPTELMTRAFQRVAREPGIGFRQLRDAIGRNKDTATTAIEFLIEDGHVEARKIGNKVGHYPLKPYPPDLPAATSEQEAEIARVNAKFEDVA